MSLTQVVTESADRLAIGAADVEPAVAVRAGNSRGPQVGAATGSAATAVTPAPAAERSVPAGQPRRLIRTARRRDVPLAAALAAAVVDPVEHDRHHARSPGRR